MFELLCLILILIGLGLLLQYVISTVIPTQFLAGLGVLAILVFLYFLFREPDGRTVSILLSVLILALLGLFLYYLLRGGLKLTPSMIATVVALLWLLSTPLIANYVLGVEEQRALQLSALPDNGGPIVVLGQGTTRPNLRPTPPDQMQVQLTSRGDRIPYAAQLSRSLGGRTLIVSAGPHDGVVETRNNQSTPAIEANDIRTFLAVLGLVPNGSIIPEPTGTDIRTSAVSVRKLLDDNGLGNQIVLVTSALSMQRANQTFINLGMRVTPRPTDFHVLSGGTRARQTDTLRRLPELVPSPQALGLSIQAVGELLQTLRYRVLGWTPL